MKSNLRCAVSILLVLLAVYARSTYAAHDDAVMQADRSLIAALKSSDSKSTARLLDADFAWTDEEGRTRDKQATLQEFKAFIAENKNDSVDSHFCGQFGFVYGAHHGARFVRIWVKHEKGWQLFMNVDTPVSAEPQPAASRRESQRTDAECDSRCRILAERLKFKIVESDSLDKGRWDADARLPSSGEIVPS